MTDTTESLNAVRARVTLGGIFNRPHYARSYRLAARTLFDEAKARDQLLELAVPCIYLLRHAVELALKDLVEIIDSVQEDTALLHRLRGESVSVPQVRPEDLDALRKTHDLREILKILQRYVPLVGRAEVPASWTAVVEKLAQAEDGSDQRFRFEDVKRGKRLEPSWTIRVAVSIPIEQILLETEAVLDEAIGKIGVDSEGSLLGELAEEAYAIGQQPDMIDYMLEGAEPVPASFFTHRVL